MRPPSLERSVLRLTALFFGAELLAMAICFVYAVAQYDNGTGKRSCARFFASLAIHAQAGLAAGVIPGFQSLGLVALLITIQVLQSVADAHAESNPSDLAGCAIGLVAASFIGIISNSYTNPYKPV